MARPKLSAPFDRLRRDNAYGGYVTKLEHRGQAVRVRLLVETPEQLQALLPAAAAFWKARARWFKAFREYAASELLEELNDNLDCGQDDFRPVTASRLRALLAVPFSVTLERDDDGQIRFEMSGDGDQLVLQEHCFEVTGTLEEGITDGEVVTLM